ncbi:MAG: glycosyltransferase family 4 protein [Lachnospiraceae bacterium]|nr:glycosyltransferase family 4 protein [Lachnospiraceae bacterium]
MKKIAFINQRYGLEVVGGSEYYTRLIAEHLKDKFEVEILTTKALDYVTWENHYEKDVEDINGITVRRFNVDKERDSAKFNQFTGEILKPGYQRTAKDERDWVDAQGPFCPELVKYISENKDNYDLFIFVTYLYYTSCIGMREVFEKSVFIPTAHDEPYINFSIYEDIFKKCQAIIFLTDEEKEFVQNKFNNSNIPNVVTAVGIDMPEDYSVDDDSFKKKYGDYVIYVGRIDASKGCDTLFEYFQEYKKRNNNDLKLLLMGKDVMGIPEHKDIINLGFVSEEDKFAGVLNAKALILPSPFESLSISVLEALQVETPVIVNGKCEVLKGHCIKSNAGLYYKNYPEFEGCLNYMLDHEDVRLEMGRLGKKYVDSFYRWDIVVNKISELFEKAAK